VRDRDGEVLRVIQKPLTQIKAASRLAAVFSKVTSRFQSQQRG
jgi:hypothetical protein